MGKNKYDIEDVWFFMFATFVIGVILMWGILGGYGNSDLEELGSAVCDEEHNAEYDYYDNGVLYCKTIPRTKSYDGIRIQVSTGED